MRKLFAELRENLLLFKKFSQGISWLCRLYHHHFQTSMEEYPSLAEKRAREEYPLWGERLTRRSRQNQDRRHDKYIADEEERLTAPFRCPNRFIREYLDKRETKNVPNPLSPTYMSGADRARQHKKYDLGIPPTDILCRIINILTKIGRLLNKYELEASNLFSQIPPDDDRHIEKHIIDMEKHLQIWHERPLKISIPSA